MFSKISIFLLILICIDVSFSNVQNNTTKINKTTFLLKAIKSDRVATPLMTTTLEFNLFGIGLKPLRTTALQLVVLNNHDIN